MPELLQAFQDTGLWQIWVNAAKALGKLKPPERTVLAALIEEHKDNLAEVCQSGLMALQTISGMDFGEDYQRWLAGYEGC